MGTDWNAGWTPPGFSGGGGVPAQQSGWEWPQWLTDMFAGSTGSARLSPGQEALAREYPGVDVGAFVQGVFTQSPEDQLAQAILEKMGGGAFGMGKGVEAQRITIARQAAHRAMQDPAYREQLAQALGWNMANGQVAAWVMKGGNVPPSPTSAGTGVPGQPAATSTTARAAAATIGTPFAPSAYGGRATDPGYTYGAVLRPDIAAAAGVTQQWGVDYELALGTQLTAPFAGIIKEADTNGPYGETVVIQMANGYTYRVAHLESMNVGVGQTVAVGGLLGLVGSTGNSTGPHVLIEMRDAAGKPIDPTPIIDSLLKGDTTGAQKYMSDYVTAASSAGPILTTDGHLIYPGSQDYDVFFAAQQSWRKRYGVDPPWTFVSSLIASGQTTTEQVQNAMDQMSSDIPNMNWGARDALTGDANNAALKAWDRSVPDSTIKQLAAQGITTPGQIQGWIQSHPASALTGGAYAQIFDAANPQTQQLWQQPPSPELVKHIHDQMQAGPQ